MQKPQESLDDFLNSIEPRPATPPPTVSLRPTGEVEVLSPLPLDQEPSKAANPLLLQNGAPRISWFHRSLIFGGGAAAAVAVIFLSAIFIAVNEPSDRASVVGVDTPDYESDASIDYSLATVEQTATADIFTSAVAPQVLGELRAFRRPTVRFQRNTPRVRRAVNLPRRTPRPVQAPIFIPTTLVIYVENGEIKNRIEPNLTAAYKLASSLSN